jgi:hypothetical protein
LRAAARRVGRRCVTEAAALPSRLVPWAMPSRDRQPPLARAGKQNSGVCLVQHLVLAAQVRVGAAGAGAAAAAGAGAAGGVTDGAAGIVGSGFNASVGNCGESCGVWTMTGGAPNWASATPDSAVAVIAARSTLVPNIISPSVKSLKAPKQGWSITFVHAADQIKHTAMDRNDFCKGRRAPPARTGGCDGRCQSHSPLEQALGAGQQGAILFGRRTDPSFNARAFRHNLRPGCSRETCVRIDPRCLCDSAAHGLILLCADLRTTRSR